MGDPKLKGELARSAVQANLTNLIFNVRTRNAWYGRRPLHAFTNFSTMASCQILGLRSIMSER